MLTARMMQEPQNKKRQEDLERFRQQRIAEFKRASAPVVADLVSAGFNIEWVGQLYNYKLDYKIAIPILLRWLPCIENDDVKEDIVRALSVKWAKPWAARPLVEEYQVAYDPKGIGLKWAIGNALSVVADDSVFDEVVELVRDKQHGKAREMLAIALGNMRDPRAVDVLIGLLDDGEVAGHAIVGLGKLKAQKARPHIERFLNHPKSWIRQEAKQALSKIDKAAQHK